MLVKLKKSFKNINYKLFIALLFMGLCPTIYNTLRVFWLGEMPGEYCYFIGGAKLEQIKRNLLIGLKLGFL